jgi:hypothetical protein
VEPDFLRSLDANELPRGFSPNSVRFLHMAAILANQPVTVPLPTQAAVDADGFELIPDIKDPAIFMLQVLPAETDPSEDLLCFYDSGCAAAGISDRARGLLRTVTVREGPTVLDVAGAKSITIPYGDEKFHIELDGTRQKATITGLRMAHITTTFPMFQLTEAWCDLNRTAMACNPKVYLPEADAEIGGRSVDIILGSRYLKYYPTLVFTLPSGLSVYRAKFRSASGRQAVLGGPHAAWFEAASKAQHMNPRVYLTMEARAWYVEQKWVELNQGKLSTLASYSMEDPSDKKTSTAIDEDEDPSGCCDHCHCEEEAAEEIGMFTVAAEERRLWKVEELGTESPYRCVSCRKCSQCRDGPSLEATSFKEEAEQALIEESIELDLASQTVWAKLPFVEDPAEKLRPNRFVAEKVLKAQLEMFRKNPTMREDALKSHQKLEERGYVLVEDDLPDSYKQAIGSTPGAGYFIPWRTVYNEGSLSTPCRIVFDASSKSPGGESLNGVLAKGQNRLSKLQHLLIRFRKGAAAVTADISMAYNGMKLRPEFLKYQRYLWKKDLLPENPTVVMVVATLIYGVKPSGQQCQVSLEKLALHFEKKAQCMNGARVLREDTYVDDILSSQDSVATCEKVGRDIVEILAAGSMGIKALSFSKCTPSEKVSADGVFVGVAGYLWNTLEDTISLDIGPPRLGRAKRGKKPVPVAGDIRVALSQCFTRRILTGLVAGIFDPLGLTTPVTAGFKLDLHELCRLKLDWDDPVPAHLLDKWVGNMETIQELKHVVFRRTVIPEDAANAKVELLVATDASQNLGIVAVFGRVLRKNGMFSCQLMMGRSKLLTGLTVPKAELKSAMVGAVTASVVRRNLGSLYSGTTFVTDSTICLYWISQDDRPLQVGVRNAVCEVRRFSEVADWHHVDTDQNIADLGTRKAEVGDITTGSEWQDGKEWMRLPRAQMPIKTAADVTLSAEEKRQAAEELRAKDVRGHLIALVSSAVADRYSHSKYLVDPCSHSWSRAVRILSIALKFVNKCREKGAAKAKDRSELGSLAPRVVCLSQEDIAMGENYFFKKATREVLQFVKPKDYRSCTVENNGILYFSGRLLNSNQVTPLEEAMFDLSPTTFVRPFVDRHSPVAYSIMLEAHWSTANHLSATTTYRESLTVAYINKGRELAQEIRDACCFCKRYKARMVEVEMGRIHESRLTIAPPFTLCQVDLLGPFEARCEHNHRSTVKVWGVIFKDPASGAVFVHAMSKCDTSAFIQAYTRFAARFCHPKKLFPDEGSQLLKACQEMEISWVDVSFTLNSMYKVGVEFTPCPVGGHNFHGQVERSIREVKKLFETVYKGVKLDLLGFETAFAWISNELNNLPLCLGSRYKNLEMLDLITPNRLVHGRANRRAMSGLCTFEKPSKMLAKMEDVFNAWWEAWYRERLLDYVAKPPKWVRSDLSLKIGDVVIFQKKAQEQVLGQPIWTIGRVVEAKESASDGKVRDVVIEYRNNGERKFRTTHRASRSVAVLHREDELDLMQELSLAAGVANKQAAAANLYFDRQAAVVKEVNRCVYCVAPTLCGRHLSFFYSHPFMYAENPEDEVEKSDVDPVQELVCTFTGNSGSLCAIFAAHSDPWGA